MTKWRDPISEAKRQGWNEAIDAAAKLFDDEARREHLSEINADSGRAKTIAIVREMACKLNATRVRSLTKPEEGGE